MRSNAFGVALVLFVPIVASAYVRTPITIGRQVFDGTCLYWDSRTIPWRPARMPDGRTPSEALLWAMRDSFREWEAESCSDLAFEERALGARDVGFSPKGSNENVVVFHDVACDDIPWSDPCHEEFSCDCWNFSREMIAVTTTTFIQCTGEIVDADIELNGAHYAFTTGDGPPCRTEPTSDCVDTDVQNTLVHEIGHLIGLDHSNVREATMYAQAERGETLKRSLHADDVEALCDIYPAGEPTWTCAPAPRSVCAAKGGGEDPVGCGSGAGGFAWAGFVATLAWAGLRRRRDPGGAGERLAVDRAAGRRRDDSCGGGGL